MKANDGLIYRCVNLDKIPGDIGFREWRHDRIDAAAAASYANHQKMGQRPRSLRGAASLRAHAGEAVTMPPPVSVKFPEVVAAVRAAERCLWKIGDALIKECGPPGEPWRQYRRFRQAEQCARELQRLGLETYSLDHLRDLRRTAANFSDGDRSPSASWTVHSEAGDPATLKAAMEAAARERLWLTVEFVKTLRSASGREKSTPKTHKAPRRWQCGRLIGRWPT